jgi:competence ComEA-like helix-hairpin-helix protein
MSSDERKALAFVALLLGMSVVARAVNRPDSVHISGGAAVHIPTRLQQNQQSRQRPAKPVRATSPRKPPAPKPVRPPIPPLLIDNRSETEPGPINVNRATAAELDALPGIGPAVAQRIVAYRESVGQFQTVEQLDSVKGIGPALMAKLRPLVVIR